MRYPNGNEALKDVNLTISQGEFVFIVGKSGAGKTTLTKLLMCEERISSGSLRIGPYKLEKLPRRRIPYLRRKMGVVFQDFRLFDNRTAYDNIAFALRVTGESKRVIELACSGNSNPEIADILGIAINTVKVLKNRAVQKLKDYFAQDNL